MTPTAQVENTTKKMMQLLCEKLEQACHRRMQTPRDFSSLSNVIYEQTHQLIHASTLKRIFGYVNSVNLPRESTLDILCTFLGYASWQDFLNKENCTGASASKTILESGMLFEERLHTDEMQAGERLCITWQPGRRIVVECLGNRNFRVTEAENSKLQVGNTFCCLVFMQHQPLYLSRVVGLIDHPTDFVCGRLSGIEYELLPTD